MLFVRLDFSKSKTMDVRKVLFKLLLFQTLVAWCGAKHVTITTSPTLEHSSQDSEDVQNSIRNLIHSGIYSHRDLDTSQVQVVHPVKVTREGALVSHAVDHSHDQGHARARRDLRNGERLKHVLHYNITVDGKPLRLDLRPSVTFITPALVIERRRVGEHIRSKPQLDATSCHYTGSVRGQKGSSIALSACDGLAGLLRTQQGEYWIEPSNQIPTNGSEGRPHVIFKRSAMDKVQANQRAKRSIDNKEPHTKTQFGIHSEQTGVNPRINATAKKSRENKEAMDRRRREFLEERRKRLKALRQNPTEFRRQQSKLRMEQRRLHSNSKSNSVEISKSHESSAVKNKNKRNKSKIENRQQRRMKNKRRRQRREKNCATIQPPYQWNITKAQNQPHVQQKQKNNKKNRRYPHHLQQLQQGDSKRSTRSVSRPRHVEVLLVADKSMTDFHSQGNLETYLLTIMNIVSSLYSDPSIGNYIKVVVVKIILIEEIQTAADLEVSTNADTTLSSFCRWQSFQNPDNDDHPHHHDVAILVTRQDICSINDLPCSTLGVAHVAGMCKPDRSCSVNEDNGIMLAHTITHELGHNFGLYHDTEKIGCHRREGSTLHIMTPYFEADTVQVAWSRCSKRDVTMFLDAGMGECLGDQPSQQEYVYPEAPAGVTFDAPIQCRLQFGVEATVCSEPARICDQLWCLVNDTCKSMLRPPAPGTTCGPDMWCQNQECVPRMPKPVPRDGGWGPWTEWSECSRTCGAGVSTQSRECNNPKPDNNGNYCIGDRSRYKICNTDPCAINEPTFREVQCAKYNNMTYNNITFTDWIPYIDQDKPCELQCVPRTYPDDDGAIGGVVADGTPCRQELGSRDMCISGVCYKVGCDWIVDSEVEDDICGVCGGDGSACKTVQGIYNKGITKQTGFSEVAVIPAGSRNVKIQEKVNPENFISIGSAKSKKVYFSGARNSMLTEYFVAGSQAIYERDRDWEKVRIPGPIAEDIKVYQRIFRGKHRNPGVTYEYTVDRQKAQRFRYRLTEWSPCSVTCGVGYMRRYHECVDHHAHRVVEQARCYHIEPPRHDALMQQCHMAACPPQTPSLHTHWWVGAWNPCSKACHMPGEKATKQRSVYCVNKLLNRVVNDSDCDLASKPMTNILCADVPAC